MKRKEMRLTGILLRLSFLAQRLGLFAPLQEYGVGMVRTPSALLLSGGKNHSCKCNDPIRKENYYNIGLNNISKNNGKIN